MNEYRIEIKKKAEKFIIKQPKSQQALIFDAISNLPHNGDIKKVEGRTGYYSCDGGRGRLDSYELWNS